MAEMLIDGVKLDACLDAEADAIRAKTGGSADIPFDYANNKGFADAIAAIPSGTTITDGIVVKARNANGRITEVDKYGDCDVFEFGTASNGYREFPYGYLETINLNNCTVLGDGAMRNKYIQTINGLERIVSCGVTCFMTSDITAISLPAVTSVGDTCFRNLSQTCKSVYLPVLQSQGDYVFQSSTNLENVQIGSVEHPAPTTNNQPFYGCAQSGLTITAYQTGANVDTLVANYRRNATNATIIIKASEATTYNGTTYAAGDTILTSEVT